MILVIKDMRIMRFLSCIDDWWSITSTFRSLVLCLGLFFSFKNLLSTYFLSILMNF